jgi:hypothetical protein
MCRIENLGPAATMPTGLSVVMYGTFSRAVMVATGTWTPGRKSV